MTSAPPRSLSGTSGAACAAVFRILRGYYDIWQMCERRVGTMSGAWDLGKSGARHISVACVACQTTVVFASQIYNTSQIFKLACARQYVHNQQH
jgi:hypothetical protein